MALLIVESPNKISKIKKSLPNNFVVMASVGHIMDLEKKDLGIDLNTFDAIYKVNDDKKDIVKALKAEAMKHDEIYVATDPDREGEGIAHNILSILPKKGKSIYRVTFKELSKSAITQAIKNPVNFDNNLFEAQQARRMTDRLVGFKISPVMWAKGLKKTSAGRVQSATLKWLVDREKEIRVFKSEEYWTIKANFKKGFSSDLALIDGNKPDIKTEQDANKILSDFGPTYKVTSYISKVRERNPRPPFITATLQQEASTKLNWNSKKTMDVAQNLFSGGLITYHRTDSLRVEIDKINLIREKIESTLGAAYVSKEINEYKNEDASQDAHEAIRPTFEPVPTTLNINERKLLDLITNRFMASQMAPALYDQTNIEISNQGSHEYVFKVSGQILKFDGFLKVYGTLSDDVVLPQISDNEILALDFADKTQHFTKPPGRYTEASFINKMKKDGVGRPSTYATVPETLIEHGYITRDNKNLRPTESGIMVSDYLSFFFKDIANADFTAKLEKELDNISNGTASKATLMQNFYNILLNEVDNAKTGNPSVIFKTDIDCPSCKDGSKMTRKIGPKGVFLGCENWPTCGQVMNYDEDGNLIKDKVEEGLPCPVCSSKLIERDGKYGKWLGCSSYPTCTWTGKKDENGGIVENKLNTTDIKCDADKCDGHMIKRSGKWGDWLGCSNYPKCKNTKKFDKDGAIIITEIKKAVPTGQKCSKCKTGELIERDGKFGKFKGCSNYPKCKHIEK
jgi:DNA topoisomerase-1